MFRLSGAWYCQISMCCGTTMPPTHRRRPSRQGRFVHPHTDICRPAHTLYTQFTAEQTVNAVDPDVSVYCSRSLSWSFNVWPAKHRRTCQTIASLSLTPDRAVSGHPHPIHCRVSFDVHTTRMVTGALPLQGRGSGLWNSAG